MRERLLCVVWRRVAWLLGAAAGCVAPIASRGGGASNAALGTAPAPLVVQAQGSVAVGGTVVTVPGTFDPIAQGAYTPTPDPKGQTVHGDHASVFYQVPVAAHRFPLVFWHGHGQSAKTWETTSDGREGFQTLFLRRRFPVYLLDQPRRGWAAKSTQPGSRGSGRASSSRTRRAAHSAGAPRSAAGTCAPSCRSSRVATFSFPMARGPR